MANSQNLYQRIIQVYKQVRTIKKDSEIAQGNSSYTVVTHDAVTGRLHMPIAEAGIVSVPTMGKCIVSEFDRIKVWQGQEQKTKWYRADVEAIIKFINADNHNEYFESRAEAYAFDTSDKAIGKAYSMAVKSIYLKVFMLESTDEEEERVFEKDPIVEKPKPHVKKEQKPEPIKEQKLESKLIPNEARSAYIMKGGKFAGLSLGSQNKLKLSEYVQQNLNYARESNKPLPVDVIENIEAIKEYLGME